MTLWIRRIDLQLLINMIRAPLDAFFSLGTLGSLHDTASDNDEKLLADVETVMTSNAYGSEFNRTIEERFKRSTAEPRGKLFVRVAIVGTIIYNLFLLIDMLVVPDVMWLAVALQLGVVTPITAVLIFAIWRFGIDPELPSLICLVAMMAATIAIFMVSRSPDVNLFACIFGLFLVAANVALAIGFKSALGFSLCSIVAVSTAIVLHPSLGATDEIFSIAFLVAMANYSLGGCYRIDAGVRTAYLFALRESLRARLLDASNQRLKTLITVDGLTGVGNRRYLDERLQARWQEPLVDQPLALLLIDIDHFKRFNDDHGHQTGDECLRQVAQALAGEVTGEAMTLARYGGEEFAVVVPSVAVADVVVFAEHLRRTVERLSIKSEKGAALRVTVSIGCAAITPSAFTAPTDLIGAADAALYQAKRAGRNRVDIAILKSSDMMVDRPAAVEKALRNSRRKAR